MSDRETARTPGTANGRGPLGVDFPLAPSSDPGWLIVEEGFTLVREREIKSLFAIANGYIGTRASLEEGGRFSQPDTFAAGSMSIIRLLSSGRHLPCFPIGRTLRSRWTATACR